MILIGLDLHSNQGFKYNSIPYHILTSASGITSSISLRGYCWDTAAVENFFGHLKEEYTRGCKNLTYFQAQKLTDEYTYLCE
jgi:transposase InsO family protein